MFVGGVVRGLLVTDSAVEGPRATDDVDTIIEISTLLQYQAFESELRPTRTNAAEPHHTIFEDTSLDMTRV